MRILGIETSCDETSAAVVQDGRILSNVVSSQADLHAVYGGVVPEIASREHLKWIDLIVLQALQQAEVKPEALDAIGVTRGPGLPSALLVGVAAARGLAARLKKTLVPIHHMEAHLYSPNLQPPFIALIVSGGHTLLVHVHHFGDHEVLGQTVDDAAGEAFDKGAQLLKLSYPGGPAIEREAKSGNPRAFDFPRPMLDSGDWNFSFSGLKTSLRRTVATLGGLTPQMISDLSASFQAAIVEVLVRKTLRAAQQYRTRHIAISGGVGCNQSLRSAFENQSKGCGISVQFADPKLCTDNAAMIALLTEKKLKYGMDIEGDWDIEPDWKLK
jgi:N6-L-threonylcarbamoyladenine synthase